MEIDLCWNLHPMGFLGTATLLCSFKLPMLSSKAVCFHHLLFKPSPPNVKAASVGGSICLMWYCLNFFSMLRFSDMWQRHFLEKGYVMTNFSYLSKIIKGQHMLHIGLIVMLCWRCSWWQPGCQNPVEPMFSTETNVLYNPPSCLYSVDTDSPTLL